MIAGNLFTAIICKLCRAFQEESDLKYRSQRIIRQLLSSRRFLIELFIAAIVLSLSINLISNAILYLEWVSPRNAFYLASMLTTICFGYFVIRFVKSHTNSYDFEGFLVLQKKENKVVKIMRYDYGYNLHRYLNSAFTENVALKRLWDKEPICKGVVFDKDTGSVSLVYGQGHRLIKEATEYFVLETLSTHLTDYFNRTPFKEEKLHTFERNDIPDVLLSNRFLELFSKPMEERALFFDKDATNGKRKGKGEDNVVMSMTDRGAFFSKFNLTLPNGAQVSRDKSNALLIGTKRFELRIEVIFGGFSLSIPWEYKKHILGLDFDEAAGYQVHVRFETTFKLVSFLLPTSWDYYHWIESFMETFDKGFSKGRYFQKIGWESALTVFNFLEKRKPS